MATQQQQIDFVNKYGAYAGGVSSQTGIPANFILGQWALETGYGTQFAGKYNIGNIQGAAARPYDYTSEKAGVDAYAHTLQNPRYTLAKEADTPEQFGVALKQAGYAADPDYASKIAQVINKITSLVGGDSSSSSGSGSGKDSMFDFSSMNPMDFIKSRALDAIFLVVGGGLIIFLLINATKGEIVKAAVSEAL
jgi:flagellum-specific peptidoglycan hydrolase FlgJ